MMRLSYSLVRRISKKRFRDLFSLDPGDEFNLRDQGYYNLERQNRAMEEFVNQQQKNRNREKIVFIRVTLKGRAQQIVCSCMYLNPEGC